MPTRNVNLTQQLDDFITSRVATGRYENASEVIRAALRSLQRADEQYEVKMAALKQALEDGFASGVAEGDPFQEILDELEDRPERIAS